MKEKTLLKTAIFLLLDDQVDTCDLELDSSDEFFIDLIAEMAVKLSGKTVCPFKNYNCKDDCEKNKTWNCEDELNYDCPITPHEAWLRWIELNSGEKVERLRE